MPHTNFMPTGVNPSGLTALIQNLGRDCHPTQFIREFTKNAIEACQRTKAKDAKVVIDYNQVIFNKGGLHKICFIDNGDGMSPDQMINLLNSLSASGDFKNQFQNYGVGAKISALTRNHCGIQYESWKDGVGHMILIKFNADEGIYGVQGFPLPDGSTSYAMPLKDVDKPSEIDKHGTRVTLWGMDDQQDTMLPPEDMADRRGIKESWIALYMNTRFFRIPDAIQMSARIGYYRESNPRHNYLLSIRGQKSILDEKAEIKGEQKLSDAKVYWWVMPKNVDGHGRELVKGHTALIHEDEIFDISDSRSNRAGYFGIILGRDRVIIYVEPANVVQNTARTNLLRPNGSPVSWDKWQDEFRTDMPEKLKAFLDELQNENNSDSHTDSIWERLKGLKELYKLSRFKPDATGKFFADPKSESSFGTSHQRDGDQRLFSDHKPGTGTKPGSISTALLTSLVDENAGLRSSSTQPNPFPRVEWTNPTTDHNEGLIDRAAEYIPTSNVILANSEFEGIRDLIKYFCKSYNDVPEVTKIIEDEVKRAFEQSLTEAVAGALSLKNRKHWNPADFDSAISREALTTAVMPRYWMVSDIRRVLGSKIKGFSGTVDQAA